MELRKARDTEAQEPGVGSVSFPFSRATAIVKYAAAESYTT